MYTCILRTITMPIFVTINGFKIYFLRIYRLKPHISHLNNEQNVILFHNCSKLQYYGHLTTQQKNDYTATTRESVYNLFNSISIEQGVNNLLSVLFIKLLK